MNELMYTLRKNFYLNLRNCFLISNLKSLKIFLWKKRRFRLRWDLSPGQLQVDPGRLHLFNSK